MYAGRVDEVGDALLPGDPAKEHDRRRQRVDPVVGQHVGALVAGVLVGIDAVVDHVDPSGVDVGIGSQDVVPHGGRHRDHGIGGLHGCAFDV